MLWLSSADFFSTLTFSKNSLRSTIRLSNASDSEQDLRFVCPDLCATVCLGYQQITKVAVWQGKCLNLYLTVSSAGKYRKQLVPDLEQNCFDTLMVFL